MTTALQQRLALFYDESPARRVMARQAQWPAGFGAAMADILSIVPHQTVGWPDRDGADRFVDRYINPANNDHGVGPQFYISSDGTAFRLIDMPRETWHATFVNPWSIGVETGRLGAGDANVLDPPNSRWRELTAQAEDIPGAKIYAARRGQEIMVCWFTTASYRTPARQPPGAGEMLFTEHQYRTWAVLARWLAEEWDVPRNFPLLPHAQRWEHIDDPAAFRRIMLADERFDVIVRGLAGYNLTDADFASDAALGPDYRAAVLAASGARARHNQIWLDFFDHYRGFHGHGFSGSIRRKHKRDAQGNWILNPDGTRRWFTTDHDCPGPLFDWHRFAREVWDWWWEPFDFDAAFATTAVPQRPYRTPDGDTPLIEYYYDPAVAEARYFARMTEGIQGADASPSTFELEQGSPVYALANGELVAARFPEDRGVSMAFVLVRHELFHQPSPTAAAIAAVIEARWGWRPPPPERVGYDLEPTYVYSLHMHLGRPAGMSFDAVTPANPDWLNRVIARFIESRDGPTFAAASYTNAQWSNAPPGRMSIRDQWLTDRDWYEGFLISLASGDVAMAPPRMSFATPMQVILGDFLGNAGVIRQPPSGARFGIRVETFTGQILPATAFSYVLGQQRWAAPSGLPNPPLVHYRSEWAQTPGAFERVGLIAIGVDPDLVSWWDDVATWTSLDNLLPPEAQLPAGGWVWHCRPHDLMRWINQVTYRNEWSKYEVTDAGGNPVPFQPIQRPRSRRI